MTITSIEGLLLLLAFVVPGYVMSAVMNFVSPRAHDPSHLALLRFLMLSCVNVAACWWLLPAWPPSKENLPAVPLHTWGLMTLASPIVLGLVGGIALAKEWPTAVLKLVRVRAPLGAPSAWNYRFARLKSGALVIVTLKNGNKVYGRFGSESMAASTLDRGDLFLQQIYRLSESGDWQVIPRQDGVLLSQDSIQSIEFLRETS